MFNTLPHFLAYFGIGVILLVGYLLAYVMITPHREFTLIREGNTAAAIQLIGSVLGFALPFAVVISHSVSLSDMVAWGLVVLVVQSLTFWIVQVTSQGISTKITSNCTSSGIYVGGMAFAVGVIQAGCMVP
jgi:putative membrane protein